MDRLFNLEQLRIIFVTVTSPIIAYMTTTSNFIFALIIAFAFNLFAGMRADGISISRCINFKFSKFKNALLEICLYLVIIHVLYSIVILCGDKKEAYFVIKSLTYVFIYVYATNSFKNLIKAYPKNVALRIIFHILRLEFTRAMPSYWKPIIERLQKETDDDIINDKEKEVRK